MLSLTILGAEFSADSAEALLQKLEQFENDLKAQTKAIRKARKSLQNLNLKVTTQEFPEDDRANLVDQDPTEGQEKTATHVTEDERIEEFCQRNGFSTHDWVALKDFTEDLPMVVITILSDGSTKPGKLH